MVLMLVASLINRSQLEERRDAYQVNKDTPYTQAFQNGAVQGTFTLF